MDGPVVYALASIGGVLVIAGIAALVYYYKRTRRNSTSRKAKSSTPTTFAPVRAAPQLAASGNGYVGPPTDTATRRPPQRTTIQQSHRINSHNTPGRPNGKESEALSGTTFFQSQESLNSYGQAQRWGTVDKSELDNDNPGQKGRKNSKPNAHRVSFSTTVEKNVFNSETAPDVSDGLHMAKHAKELKMFSIDIGRS